MRSYFRKPFPANQPCLPSPHRHCPTLSTSAAHPRHTSPLGRMRGGAHLRAVEQPIAPSVLLEAAPVPRAGARVRHLEPQ
eukprot:3945553-Prymnesium_polylepis.1